MFDISFLEYHLHPFGSRFHRCVFRFGSDQLGPTSDWLVRSMNYAKTLTKRIDIRGGIEDSINAVNIIGGRLFIAEPYRSGDLRNPCNGNIVLIKQMDRQEKPSVAYNICYPKEYEQYYGDAVIDTEVMMPDKAFVYLLLYPWMTQHSYSPRSIEKIAADNPLKMGPLEI